jgi:hypothetical protein
MQLFVGKFFVNRRLVTFPDDRYLVASGFEVAVKAVVGDVEFAAHKPFQIDFILAVFPILNLIPLFIPGDILFGDF